MRRTVPLVSSARLKLSAATTAWILLSPSTATGSCSYGLYRSCQVARGSFHPTQPPPSRSLPPWSRRSRGRRRRPASVSERAGAEEFSGGGSVSASPPASVLPGPGSGKASRWSEKVLALVNGSGGNGVAYSLTPSCAAGGLSVIRLRDGNWRHPDADQHQCNRQQRPPRI